ncbi:MAG: hypothetical protein ACTHLE_07375 [Agriterribacter sp.]
MKTLLNFVLVCVFSVALISCQKELSFEIPVPGTNPGDNDTTTNPANNKLIGTWKFVNFDITAESRTQATILGETMGSIAKYSTVTINNTGTITFDATNSTATGIGYDIDTEVNVKSFGGGVPPEDLTLPFQFSLDPYNASAKYKIIGTDSLYFPEGTFFDMPDANGQPANASQPMGGKFSINGNTLIITSSVAKDTAITQQGLTYDVSQRGTGKIKLERQ